MSYDLYFRTRSGTLPAERFEAYFTGRPNYKYEARQAVYENSDTDVYFLFEQSDGSQADEDSDSEAFAAAFNINYFRPSVFGLEAEPEVAAFVRAFNLTVVDPQEGGMGEGEYSSEGFLRGWNAGNAFAFRAFVSDPNGLKPVKSAPQRQVQRVWAWNFGRAALQQKLGEDRFVPAIFFFEHANGIATYSVWPDGCPIAVPDVDYFYVMRNELAPRRFLRRKEDWALLAWKDAAPVFSRHREKRSDRLFVLDYDSPPADVRKFVTGLPRLDGNLKGVYSSEVLDQELVDQGLAAKKK